MPISEKAQRAWKSGTAVVTAWTFFYGLFYIDYGPHEHVFTDLQRWYRRKLDGLLGIDVAQATVSQKKQIYDGRGDDNCTINEVIVDIPKVVVEEGNTTKIVSASEQEGANRKWWWR